MNFNYKMGEIVIELSPYFLVVNASYCQFMPIVPNNIKLMSTISILFDNVNLVDNPIL
jgi:hypothetical protein